MTEPTAAEIERVATAMAVQALRRDGYPEAIIQFTEVHGREDAVASYGDLARVAIVTIREPVQ